MGSVSRKQIGRAYALIGCAAALSDLPAQAQTVEALPPITVTSTRLMPVRPAVPARGIRTAPAAEPGTGEGEGASIAPAGGGGGAGGPSGPVSGTIITGASSSVISRGEIERSPGQTLQDLLAREAGIQVTNLFGAVGGARTTVDMRGFGVTGSSNTLVLINGRRLNDIDLQGVDFTAVPLNSIERVEITRGNSGSVLYGDGAVGGVINIITKGGVDLPTAARVQGGVGSYNYTEGLTSVAGSVGNYSASVHTNLISAHGYRDNNRLHQQNAVGDFRWTDRQGTTTYLALSGDLQNLGFPGGLRVTPTVDLVAQNPRAAATPFDFGNKQGMSATAGFTREFIPGTELIVDGGVRQKNQQAAFFSSFGPAFDSGFKATLTQFSFTPRLASQHSLGWMPGKLLTGVDLYDSTYGSNRSLHLSDPPIHRYDLGQRTLAGYFQETVGLLPSTDLALGARVQNNQTTARDQLNLLAPGASFPTPQGLPLDTGETQHALHAGIEHRLNAYFALFGRAARSFRLPTVDERVGMSPFGVPTTFDLRTQTSHDAEGGIRFTHGGFTWQSSYYDMRLKNELYFSPATFTNINLDPTHRYGVETIASWQVTPALRLKGGFAYTRSVFIEGPFAGNDVPLVSRWTGSAGLSWDIYGKWLVFDGAMRFFGPRHMDNDATNRQLQIPGQTLVDLRIGGEVNHLVWSFAVQNVFDVRYFEYAISALDFVTGLPNFGTYNAYPLPGRTFMAKAGVTW